MRRTVYKSAKTRFFGVTKSQINIAKKNKKNKKILESNKRAKKFAKKINKLSFLTQQ